MATVITIENKHFSAACNLATHVFAEREEVESLRSMAPGRFEFFSCHNGFRVVFFGIDLVNSNKLHSILLGV